MLAFRPNLLMPAETPAARLAGFADRVHRALRAAEVERIRMPGERGAALEAERRGAGHACPRAVLDDLLCRARDAGVSPPAEL